MSWLTRHLHALVGTLGRLLRAPLATGLTVAVMGLAMALPLAMGLLADNLRSAGAGLNDSLELSVWLRLGTSDERATQLTRTATERPGVAHARLITAQQGLAQFRAQSGFGAALDALGDNPLPNVLVVTPAPTATSPDELESLRRFLSSWPEVESVQSDGAWVQRYNALLALARRLLLALAVLLAAGVVAVVGNTIRLEIGSRQAEIEVTKLVGGTRAFVRRPFLYAGALYGLFAALLALALVEAGLLWLRPAVQQLAQAYASDFSLRALGGRLAGQVVGFGMLLGWLGAWLAATRELDKIEPGA
jgi:cell division transport system permease protein